MNSKVLIVVQKDSVAQGDNILKVIVNEISAVNESVVRVDCYTYNGDPDDVTNTSYRWYQLAIGVDSFLEKNEDGSMGILGDKFQEAVSNKIIQTRNVAELAHILNEQHLEWEIEVTDANNTDKETPKGVEGMKLAQAK